MMVGVFSLTFPRHSCFDLTTATLISRATALHQEVLGKASRAATSKTAQRTLVNLSLLLGASLFLLPVAVIATIVFFRNYLPEHVVTTPVHLQYG